MENWKVIRNPFAFYFPIQRGFSGSLLTLRLYMAHSNPISFLIRIHGCYALPINCRCYGRDGEGTHLRADAGGNESAQGDEQEIHSIHLQME